METKLDNRREIELAEGVHIHLRPVGIFPRLLARSIDLTIFTTIFSIISVVLGFASLLIGNEVSHGVYQLCAFFLFWFYDPFFEASKFSATPGKLCLKLKVVRRSGAPVGFGSSFLRGLLFWVDVLPGLGTIGTVSILCSRNSQRLGDMVADTLVVYSTPPATPSGASHRYPATRPGVLLQREEQLAFLQFADRLDTLSEVRQEEVTRPLTSLDAAQNSPSSISFALGVAQWLSLNEK